jgi:hypothetical protein
MSLNKFWFALAIVVLFVALAAGGDAGAEKLHGTWIGKSEGEPITLTFGSKNVVKLRAGKDTGEGTYPVDWNKKPAHLDIDWGKQGKVRTIIELTDDDLNFENVDPGTGRPKMFTDKAVTLKMEKVK